MKNKRKRWKIGLIFGLSLLIFIVSFIFWGAPSILLFDKPPFMYLINSFENSVYCIDNSRCLIFEIIVGSLANTFLFLLILWTIRKLVRRGVILTTIVGILLIFFTNSAHSYSVDPPSNTHQYITNESQIVWKLIPKEIKDHLQTPLNQNLDLGYQNSEDIITGSGEEDVPFTKTRKHFWQPDNPNTPNSENYLARMFKK